RRRLPRRVASESGHAGDEVNLGQGRVGDVPLRPLEPRTAFGEAQRHEHPCTRREAHPKCRKRDPEAACADAGKVKVVGTRRVPLLYATSSNGTRRVPTTLKTLTSSPLPSETLSRIRSFRGKRRSGRSTMAR